MDGFKRTEMLMKATMTAIAGSILLLTGASAFAQGDAAAGKEKSAPCAACHGADGNSPAPNFPILAGQHADYLVRALEDYKSGARKNAIMSGFAAPLSRQDREDLAAYYSGQKGPLTTIEITK